MRVNSMMKQNYPVRVFIDMDGTLATFEYVDKETLRTPGYFEDLPQLAKMPENVAALMTLPNVEVFILSACLAGTNAVEEKNHWLDKKLPEIDAAHRIFTVCGADKTAFIPGGIRSTDILLDDYTLNLRDWKRAGGKPVKLLNGINGTKGTWKGRFISCESTPEDFRTLLFEC